jgi:hypothetical protein
VCLGVLGVFHTVCIDGGSEAVTRAASKPSPMISPSMITTASILHLDDDQRASPHTVWRSQPQKLARAPTGCEGGSRPRARPYGVTPPSLFGVWVI